MAARVPASWAELLRFDTVEVRSGGAGQVRVARLRGDTTSAGVTAIHEPFESRVSLYGAAGTRMGTLTRVGQGPSEMASHTARVLTYLGGFLVADERSVLHFDQEGVLVERIGLPELSGRAQPNRGRDWDLVGTSPRGEPVLFLTDGLFGRTDGAAPARTYFRWRGEAGSWARMLDVDLNGYGGPLSVGGIRSAHVLPVRWHPLVRPGPSGSLIVAYRDPPATDEVRDSVRIYRVSAEGAGGRLAAIPYAPEPFPKGYADSALAARFRGAATLLGVRPSDLVAEHWTQFDAPRWISPLQDVATDGSGGAWIAWGAFDRPTTAWLRLYPDGRAGGHVVLGNEVTVAAARGDTLWLEDRDELSVLRYTRVVVRDGSEGPRRVPDRSAAAGEPMRRVEARRPYPPEREPLVGWVRDASYNPAGRSVAVLDFVYPTLKVFDDRFRLRAAFAFGEREDPNTHAVEDVLVTDAGAVVVVTAQGWLGAVTGDGRVYELGQVTQVTGPGGPAASNARFSILGACGGGWTVEAVAQGSVRLWASAPAGVRPPLYRRLAAGDGLEGVEPATANAEDFGGRVEGAPSSCRAGDLDVDGPARAGGVGPPNARSFIDASGGVVLAPEGPGPPVSLGRVTAMERER